MTLQTPQIQLKISLSEQLNDLLISKAAKLGVPTTQFVKHLIIKEVEHDNYPIFQASDRVIKKAKKAIKEKSKSIKVANIHEYFKNI